jgi:Undecaprenyl-phosphate galactose phosphotransferase WbaP
MFFSLCRKIPSRGLPERVICQPTGGHAAQSVLIAKDIPALLDGEAAARKTAEELLTPTVRDHPRGVAEMTRWRPSWRQRLVVTSQLAADILVALLICAVAYALQTVWGEGKLSEVARATTLPSIAVWIGLRALLGLYPGYGLDSVERLRRHVYSVCASVAMLAVLAFALQIGDLLSRPVLLLTFLGLLLVTPFTQYLTRRELKRLKLWGRPVIVLSYADTGAESVDLLESEWDLGYRPVGLFDNNLTPAGGAYRGTAYADTLAEAMTVGRRRKIDTCIFAMPYTRREQLADMVRTASDGFQHIIILPNLKGVTNSAVVARDLSGTLALEVKQNLLNPWAKRLKRGLDLFGAVVGGLIISPFLLIIAALIKLDSPGPVLFGHRRLGARDKHFLCWKFRTMHEDAERVLNEHLQRHPDLQAEWEKNHKLRDDPRITRIGRLLRKTSLDELPQLWNVLRGEMSLAGPRPIVDAEVPKYEKDYELYRRIRPGMSGFWQVGGRSEVDYSERVAMDAYYVRNWSVWLDVTILFRTVKIVLFGRGAY